MGHSFFLFDGYCVVNRKANKRMKTDWNEKRERGCSFSATGVQSMNVNKAVFHV